MSKSSQKYYFCFVPTLLTTFKIAQCSLVPVSHHTIWGDSYDIGLFEFDHLNFSQRAGRIITMQARETPDAISLLSHCVSNWTHSTTVSIASIRSHSISTSTGCRAVNVLKVNSSGRVTQVDFLCDGDSRAVSIQATYVIDASYDGDIMTMAGGIDHTYGREARSVHNESLAGVSTMIQSGESFAGQNLSVSPYFPNGTLLPYIDAGVFVWKQTCT